MGVLKVDKVEITATLLLADGETPRMGKIFLLPISANYFGAQTVGELMVEDTKVLPFVDDNDGFMMVGKNAVSAVGAALDKEHKEGEGWYYSETKVTLQLNGGHLLTGSFLVEDGLGRRPADAINAPGNWFLLLVEKTLYWVSKDHLITLKLNS